MDVRNPTSEELADLTARVSAALGYKDGEPGVSRDFPQLYQPGNARHLWIAAEGKSIAAHAGFYPALMKVEGLPFPVAGIGGVFTEEAFRGRGHAATLVEKCSDEARKEGAALALLWSDRHEFYRKHGFHLAGRQWSIALDPGHAPMLRSLGGRSGIPEEALRLSEEPGEELLRQSLELLSRYPLGIVRSPEEHALYLGGGSCRVVSAWAGRQLAAYFVIGKGKDLPGYIHEWAGAEGALHHLAAQCLEDFGHPLRLLSPQFMTDEVPWIYSLERAGIAFSAEYLALVKLLDFPRLRKLVQEYVLRLGLKPGELFLEREGEDYLVSWRGGPEARLDEAAFLRLLFGPELPEEKELQAFLPMRLWYWGMDSV